MLLDKETIYLDNVTVYFWKIEESRKELEELCKKSSVSVSHITEIKCDRRACEKLATLLIINHTLGNNAELCHNEDGAPYIKNAPLHISISHSAHYVALACSAAPVGIDIEYKAEQVLRVREKFLNDRELAATGHDDKVANMMFWTAKEAVYKIHGKKGIDFRNGIYQDTRIKSVFRAVDGRKRTPYKVQHFNIKGNFMLAIAAQKIVKSKN